MNRILTITVLLLGMLHAAGFSHPGLFGASCEDICESHTPRVEVTETSCCVLGDSTQSTQDDYCPMSDGPCVCGVRPVENQHREPLPMPQRDRDTLQMLRAPPITQLIIETITPARQHTFAFIDLTRSGFTHNQKQAFLGIWRR